MNGPFQDFVYMVVLLQAQRITAIDPSRPLIQYLRRSTSICDQRTLENFTTYIPMQLRRLFEGVMAFTRDDEHQLRKLDVESICNILLLKALLRTRVK